VERLEGGEVRVGEWRGYGIPGVLAKHAETVDGKGVAGLHGCKASARSRNEAR
jgi:hypothetical protein